MVPRIVSCFRGHHTSSISKASSVMSWSIRPRNVWADLIWVSNPPISAWTPLPVMTDACACPRRASG
jgi:hypothetical protein